MQAASELLKKFVSESRVIGIIGLDYNGLHLAANLAMAGVKVIGFDPSATKVNQLNHGDNCTIDIETRMLHLEEQNIGLCATSDFSRITECDALLVCVPEIFKQYCKQNGKI